MNLSQFDFHLPSEQIAKEPFTPRDHSRLMKLNKSNGDISHHIFFDLPKLLTSNDVLVFNQTKVIPARLYAHKTTGGKVEVLLLKNISLNTWQVLTKPGLKLDQKVIFSPQISATVTHLNPDQTFTLEFNQLTNDQIDELGSTPIPHYIDTKLNETDLRKRYQTTYAKIPGSAAAPTAGLHFTPELLQQLKEKGIQLEFVTLHVGLGTFKPLREENLNTKKLHTEYFQLDKTTANNLNEAKSKGKRIISVGTTTTRVLETCTKEGMLIPQSGETDIFIFPPYQFKFIDGLITNFHLPKSSLIMLVSSLSKKPEYVTNAYKTAIKENYRFYSFGDSMLIV